MWRMEAAGTVWRAEWPVDPMEAAQRLEERYPRTGASGPMLWAVWTVEGLHYLADVDAALPPPPHAHNHEAVDLTHARWATVDAVTAIDLCAAALGRMYCDYPKNDREMDFGNARQNEALLALAAPGEWIRAVCADDQYEQLRVLRDALVHRTASRHIELTIREGGNGGSRTSRVRLRLSPDAPDPIPVERLVPQCREVAERHVAAFLATREDL